MMTDSDRVADEIKRLMREKNALPPPAERRALRERAGLSLRDVASAMGVTGPAVIRWESGQRMPRGRNLPDYLRVLDTLRQHLEAEGREGEEAR
jgi:transcriptional regulator with XRE-family HTH domain